MSDLKKNYEVIAIGHIKMKAIQDSRTEKILAQNHNVIEKTWQKILQEKSGDLFNGAISNFIRLDKKGDALEIISHFVEYKQFLAQMKNPALELGIKPIGVSGITVLKDKGNEYVFFSERADNVTEYPGFLELVPSGSIDKEYIGADGIIDYRSQLLSEFTEETGLAKEHIKGISGFALVLDVNHNVYDICCEILLEAKKELIAQELSLKEYNTPVFVSMDDLDSFIKTNAASIVPTSMALIEAYWQNKKE